MTSLGALSTFSEMQRGEVGRVERQRVQPHLRQGGGDVCPGSREPLTPEMSASTPCLVLLPLDSAASVQPSGRFSHHSSRSAGSLLPAGQWRLGSRRGLELLLPPHLGQDLLNLPLGQLRNKQQMIRTQHKPLKGVLACGFTMTRTH